MEFDAWYKEFIRYKIFHFNVFQKIHSWEDFRFTMGLIKHAIKLVFKSAVNNESLLGR